MGRNAKPVSILQAEGKKHLTKAEIEKRKKSEIKVGSSVLKCPAFVKKNVVAYKKWQEVLEVYKDVDFVSSGDIGLLARYCMSFSEYENLLECRDTINKIDSFLAEEIIEAEEVLSEKLSDRQITRLFRKMDFLISVDGLMAIETSINKKMDMLIKMEDRLFLNPLAKIKNIPKETKEEEQQSKWSSFGAGKSG